MAATAALPATGNHTPILSPSQSPPVAHGAIGALPAHLSPPPQIKAGSAGHASTRPVSASANRNIKPGTAGTGSGTASAAGSRPGTPAAKALTCSELVNVKANTWEKECCC